MDSQDTSNSEYLCHDSEPEEMGDPQFSDSKHETGSSGGSPVYSDQMAEGEEVLPPTEEASMEEDGPLHSLPPGDQGIDPAFLQDSGDYPDALQRHSLATALKEKRAFDVYGPRRASTKKTEKRRLHSDGVSMGPPKACVECGATKTPQWREGPDGPKTLCNACGVRLNRQGKIKHEGARRRKFGQGPGETEYLGRVYAQTFEDEVLQRDLSGMPARDPRMLFKGGGFLENQVYASRQWHVPAVAVGSYPGLPGFDGGATRAHVQYPLDSDVAEDVMQMGWAAAGSRPISAEASRTQVVGRSGPAEAELDCAVKDEYSGAHTLPRPSSHGQLGLAVEAGARHPSPDSLYPAAVTASSGPAAEVDYASLDAVRRMHCELSGQAECTLHEVALANAAISAVAKILAMRQAEAISAHLEVESATQRLRAFEELLSHRTAIEEQRQQQHHRHAAVEFHEAHL